MPDDVPLDDPSRRAALEETGLLDAVPDAALERLTRIASQLLASPVSLVSLVDVDRQFFASEQGLAEPWASARETPLSHSFCRHVVERDEPLVVEDARRTPLLRGNRAIDELGVIAYAGVPIRSAEGLVLGSMCAIDTVPRKWTPEDLAVLRDIAAAAEDAIELRRAKRRLEDLVRRDPLTGLGNRRLWEEEAPRELKRAERSALPLTLAVLDLDHFKAYNDEHGHARGDELLRTAGLAWRGIVRDVDVLVRLGGEEFGLLLPGTGEQEAEAVVGRLLAELPDGATASAGLAVAEPGDDLESVFARADAALYAAKAAGRNRIVRSPVV